MDKSTTICFLSKIGRKCRVLVISGYLIKKCSVDAEYVLYVFTDFPQVHTVTRFIANEPDELDLEEADVVSVYQKSPDGQFTVLIIVAQCSRLDGNKFPNEVIIIDPSTSSTSLHCFEHYYCQLLNTKLHHHLM